MVKMKDSGIEWIGEIPASWEVIKGKYLFTQRSSKGNKLSLTLLSPTQKYGVIPQSMYEELTGMKPVKIDQQKDLNLFKTIHKGDFCISLRSFEGGFEYSNYEGVVSPAYQVFYLIDNNSIDTYYKYLFKDKTFIDKMNSYTMSLRDGKNISFNDFGNTYITVPPKSEQQQIANFLDRKTTEIDELIDKINIEIDTLKQYQSSVITQAVTKGLDPNVQMKDSGIEWIGEIPETWKTIKIKYLVDKLERGTAPKYTELHETQVVNQATFSKGFFDKSNMRYSTIPASQSRGLLQYQDVLVASTGGGVLGKVHYFTEHEEFVADSHVTIVRFIAQKLIPKFGYYYLSTLYDVFNNVMAQGSTNQIELKRDTFANSFIPFPRIEEQRVIVDYLDQKVTQIQKLINSKQQQINQLTEYKNSLIFEYVTGKKQVKEAN